MTAFERMFRDYLRAMEPHVEPGLTFVNLGANDGVTADPVYPFIRRFDWAGLMVEPLPHVAERLRQNMRDHPGVRVAEAIVAVRPRTLWYVDPAAGGVGYVNEQIGSTSRTHLLETIALLRANAAHIPLEPPILAEYADRLPDGPKPTETFDPRIEDHVRELRAPCFTFDELMAHYGQARVDFLNLDLEGADFEVFSSIDLDRWDPRVICIEMATMGDEERRTTEERLEAHGYRHVARPPYSEVYVRRHD